MLKIALCDDAQIYIDTAKKMLVEWSEIRNIQVSIGCFNNGDSLLKALTKDSYDIIFLDIIMPMLTGLDVANEIRKSDSSIKIVFVSSSSDFGVKSYEVHASNYLLKPLEKEKLFAALDTVASEVLEEPEKLVFKSTGTIHRIPLRDIEYIEAQDKYVSVYVARKGAIKVLEPMYQIEQRIPLNADFFKCHRSYLINLHHVNSFDNKEIKTLTGNTVPISRKHTKEFQEMFFSMPLISNKDGDK